MKIPAPILKTALLLTVLISAGKTLAQQTESPLAKRVNQDMRYNSSEKMYIHLDRPTYLVGETIWFKMLVTDENLLFNDLSTIGYLEVIGHENQTPIQAKVILTKGKGEGAIQIPTDIASGNYLVRGYTNWMKNYPQSHFYESEICVINPFLPDYEETVAEANNTQAPDVQFFAEGGSASEGIESKIAFKVQSPDGKGLAINGKLTDQNGRIVSNFKAGTSGIGHFLFTPQNDHPYQAEITDLRGNVYKVPVNVVRKDAHAIRLKDEERVINLKVTTPGEGGRETYHLLVYNAGKSIAYQSTASNREVNFSIDKAKLRPGVNALVLFDSHQQPLAERLFFMPIGENAAISINTEKKDFKKREKISLDLKTAGLQDSLETSIAVLLKDSLPSPTQPLINTYLLLTSELKGEIENPDQYFQDGVNEEALDDLMLTHGWRRYPKDQLLGEFKPEYLPEPDGHLITGTVISQNGEFVVPNRPVFAAFPSMKVNPWVALTNNQGRFVMETRSFIGAKELVFQTNFRADSTSKIVVDNPFLPVSSRNSIAQPFDFSRISKSDLLKRSINMQSQNSYFPAKKITASPDSIAFFGKADYSYYLDDYTRFPTMEEVLSEYVPTVMIRLRKGKYYTRVIETGVHKQLFTEDPLLLMDGVPVFDTDRIIHFDPLKVKKADIVNRMYYLGPLTFPGIVSYRTYTDDLSGFEVDPRALILAYHGTLEKREFFSPVYDKKVKNDHRLADLRNLLFWSPSVKIAPGSTKRIDFYSSDQSGKYKVLIQGLSENGIPVAAITEFEVTD